MSSLSLLIKDFIYVNKIVIYTMITNFCDASFVLIDIIMLGYAGKGHLSAGFLAFAIYNIPWYLIEGILTAQDNLVARSFALHDNNTARYWSYISLFVIILICFLSTIFFIITSIIIQYNFNIRSQTTMKAVELLFLLIPGFWFHSIYRVLQKYIHSQKDILSPIISGLVGIGMNILGIIISM